MPSASNTKPTAADLMKQPFDIVATYHRLLSSDAELTMPVAAIEALVALLAASPSLTTVSETLDLLNAAAATLKRAVANPISLSAGTDLFTRYIVTSLRPGGFSSPGHSTTNLASSASGSGFGASQPSRGIAGEDDFQAVRAHLLSNARLFASRAKEARQTIARLASRFVRAGSTVLTNGGSRVVGAVLREAAEAQTREGGAPRFRVVFVTGPSAPPAGPAGGGPAHPPAAAAEGAATVAALRAMQVPVAEISEAAVAYAMGRVDMALVGAEGVVESGGVISRLGTYQLALLARAMDRPVYVVAESHKFVRLFPLGQYDLGVEQRVVEFKTADGLAVAGGRGAAGGSLKTDAPLQAHPALGAGDSTPRGSPDPAAQAYFDPRPSHAPSSPKVRGGVEPVGCAEAVDYTPPELLTALVTEAGVLTPGAVSEELIKIWY